MRVSELLTEGVEKFLSLAPKTETHIENKENPHNVSKVQLGLSNVINEKQATDADFRSHKLAAVLDHPDGSVTAKKLADGSVTKEKLATGAVGRDALEEGCITEDRLAIGIRNSIAKKVEKEEGMGLSQNSFTDGEKAKLASISVTDGEGLTVDTETLVLKDSPLLLKKEGKQFVNKGESTLSYGLFAEIIGTDFDAARGLLSVRGRKADGTYVVWVRDYKGYSKTYTGTVNTVCHYTDGGAIYFGEMQGGTVTILKDMGGGAEAWRTLTTSFGSETELWQMFISYDDIRLVYFSHSSSPSNMHVERFGESGERKWTFTTYSRSKSNYGANSAIYNRRFRMAYKEGDNLYIAPVLDTNRKHAVLCIDGNGTMTGSFIPLKNFISDIGVVQDIFVQGGIVYGYAGGGKILRIDTEKERTNTLLYSGTTGNETKGISMGVKNDLYAVITSADGKNKLYQLYGDGAIDARDICRVYVEAEMENVPLDAFVEVTDKGIELLRLKENNLVSTLYMVADMYAIM